jgi:predicted ATP-grasp superfamily ATP-dependent carboligase
MASPSLIFVYEYFTGGAYPPGELPEGLAIEALGILWALLVDFRAWGAVQTMVAFDRRLENRVPGLNHETLPADQVICVEAGQHAEIFASLLNRCDAVLILAPETDGILAGLTAQAEASGVPVLGSSALAVEIAGDKAVCSRLFRQAGLPTPLTCTTSFANAASIAAEVGYPLVVKPIDGVGCEGVCRVDNLSDLPGALELLRLATSHEQILLQTFAFGVHASVSLLVAKGRCLPLSLNQQKISLDYPFKYQGSQAPLRHPAAGRAFELAQAAVALAPGLCGYVGVDLVLSEVDAQLIEINPRLTTSYIGLRQIARLNLAEAIWNACRHGVLPTSVALTGQVSFSKDDPKTWRLGVENSSPLPLSRMRERGRGQG